MQYSILKDNIPSNTIQIIKEIINKLKIEVNETYTPADVINKQQEIPTVSLRLETKNPYLGGVNGKGTSIVNATASAYAEFIERLQNFLLLETPWLVEYAKDRFYAKSKLIKYENDELQKYFTKKFKENKQYYKKNKYIFLPFYNINDKNIYNLPYDIILHTQGSNGMAAGNTVEEACVQGLSEICERYAIKEVFFNKLSLPDIPSDEYIKYDNIKNILKYYKAKGYNVSIKDASLGGLIPVVCSIFEKNDIYTFVFGSQPSLPIAIERTLTEFAQNNNLDEHITTIQNLPYYSRKKFKYSPIEHITHSMFYTRISFEKNKFITDCFYNDNTSYNFSRNAWLESNEKITNFDALKFIINKIKSISKNIYIRDVNFLGFPSIYIFIPNMSQISSWNKKEYSQLINLQNWLEYKNNKNRDELYNVKTLLQLANHYMTLHAYWAQWNNSFDAQPEYIAFLCSVLLKDKKKIQKFKDIIIAQNKIYDEYTEEQLIMFEIINDYFKLQDKYKDKKTIKKILSKKYNEEDVKDNIRIADKLTFKTIVSIFINKEKKIKINKRNKNRIINRILNEYVENCPSQNNLETILGKYSE